MMIFHLVWIFREVDSFGYPPYLVDIEDKYTNKGILLEAVHPSLKG